MRLGRTIGWSSAALGFASIAVCSTACSDASASSARVAALFGGGAPFDPALAPGRGMSFDEADSGAVRTFPGVGHDLRVDADRVGCSRRGTQTRSWLTRQLR